MDACQEAAVPISALTLRSERLGPLPLVNHFIARLGLDATFERFVPTSDGRVKLPFAAGLGVLLRSIIVEREPIYRQHQTVSDFVPAAFGLTVDQADAVSDDALGTALDRLFDADRGTLLTEVVVRVAKEFGLNFDELHNDSTTVRFCGQYQHARGRRLRGKRAAFITYGKSKDHRGDLKQLLLVLTTTRDGAVPVQFRCEAGNGSDSRTHEETWDSLCKATGRSDFLYVADSKLCSREPLSHIADRGGRLVCVIPRSRHEDGEFRRWIQTNTPAWKLVVDQRNPRRRHGPRDRWWVYKHVIPSVEGWPVIWVYSSLLKRHQEQSRRDRIAWVGEKLTALNQKLRGPRPRRRTPAQIQEAVDAVLRQYKVANYLTVKVVPDQAHSFRQDGPGRPGKSTRYVRKTRYFFRVEWTTNEETIVYDQKSDGTMARCSPTIAISLQRRSCARTSASPQSKSGSRRPSPCCRSRRCCSRTRVASKPSSSSTSWLSWYRRSSNARRAGPWRRRRSKLSPSTQKRAIASDPRLSTFSGCSQGLNGTCSCTAAMLCVRSIPSSRCYKSRYSTFWACLPGAIVPIS